LSKGSVSAAKARLIFRPVSLLELHFADAVAVGGLMFVQHTGSVSLSSIPPAIDAKILKFDPCANAHDHSNSQATRAKSVRRAGL
jgi:hypothetical protein